jgi:hypothetical protein
MEELDKVGLLDGEEKRGELGGEYGENAAEPRRGYQDAADGVYDAVLGPLKWESVIANAKMILLCQDGSLQCRQQ